MTLKEFGQCIEYNIQHNLKYAVLGLGAPGVGKSQLIQQIGKKYGYKVIDIRLAQMSEVEIGGLIYPNESRTKTVWLAPEILPNVERDGEKTILLLDEITSCSKRVQVAAYQLSLDRRIGQYTLPEGTFVIALGNREDDDGVYIQLADPLADRFEIHFLEPNFEDWKNDYALKFGVHPLVISYLSFKPAALHTQAEEEDAMRFATPRSWVRVSDILNQNDDISNPVICHKIIGNVGEKEGLQFIEYCKKKDRLITADAFMAGEAEAPQGLDDCAILVDSLVHKADFLSEMAEGEALTEQQKSTLESVIRALHRFPQAEHTIIGLKGLLDRNRVVVKAVYLGMNDKSIREFLKNNRYALGLGEEDASGGKRKWLAIWG